MGILEKESVSGIQIVRDPPSTETVAIGMAQSESIDQAGVARINSIESDAGYSSTEEDLGPSEADETSGKRRSRRRATELRRKLAKSYSFNQGASDVVGLVFTEVQSARDLPPERNGMFSEHVNADCSVTRTGFDMDPFVIISFGKKTFRTRVIRHSLNPVFNERLIFQVMNHEKNYSISFKVYDRDQFSSNDFVASASLPLNDLIQNAPTPDPATGLYELPDPWKEHDVGNPKPKRQDSKFGRILSRSTSFTNLTKLKNNHNVNTGTPSPSASSPLARSSTLGLARSLSSTSLSGLGGIELVIS